MFNFSRTFFFVILEDYNKQLKISEQKYTLVFHFYYVKTGSETEIVVCNN